MNEKAILFKSIQKALIVGILTILMMPAASAEYNKPEVNKLYDTSTVSITGVGDVDEDITAVVLYPNESVEGVDVDDVSSYENKYAYVGITHTNLDGAYCFLVKLDRYTVDNEEYKVIIQGENGRSENSFTFIDYDGVLGDIQGELDKGIMAQSILTKLEVLDIKAPDYAYSYDMNELEAMSEYIINNNDKIDTVDKLNALVKNYVLIFEIHRKDINEIEKIIENYSDFFGITMTTEYNDNELVKKSVLGIILQSAQQLNDGSDVKSTFEEAMLISEIKYTNNKSQIKKIIQSYPGCLNNSVLDRYIALNDENRNKADSYIINNVSTVNSIAQMNVLIGRAVDTALSKEESQKPSGGGGGGGSFGGPGKVYSDSEITVVTPSVETQQFQDLNAFEWASEAIYRLNKKGIVAGISETQFEPERNIKREEFAKIIGVLFELPYSETEFSDVVRGSWYEIYVSSLHNEGIISGIGNNKFGVGHDIKREDVCVIIGKCIEKYLGIRVDVANANFSDYDSVSEYARKYVDLMLSMDIISGYPDKTFRPQNSLSRAEAAVVVDRVLRIMEDKK